MMRMTYRRLSNVMFIMAALWIGISTGSSASDAPQVLESARWIWPPLSKEAGDLDMPAGTAFLRGALELPENAAITAGRLALTADNLFEVYVNGIAVGESGTGNDAWRQIRQYDVTKLLRPGRNVVAVRAANTAAGPAGLLLALTVETAGAPPRTLVSDKSWKVSEDSAANWITVDFEDQTWGSARELAAWGRGPWMNLQALPVVTRHGITGEVARIIDHYAQANRSLRPRIQAGNLDAYPWPRGIVFLAGDCSLHPQGKRGNHNDSLDVTVFTARRSRAFPEHDLPSPVKIAKKLMVLEPARPGTMPRVLIDAGGGAIGSPTVSFDGKRVYFAMVKTGDDFFHLYCIDITEKSAMPRQLTQGPFHDIDPAELPDGRIVFTSTRIGTFEEYHSPPARSLFVMSPEGGDIRPLTQTIIFDNEPEVMADGRLIFIRSDNFFDRGKVETRLHALRPDGTNGETAFGIENSPEYGQRLRQFVCGSPAPMPDGRVAFASAPGITLGKPGEPPGDWRHIAVHAADVAALPDGRLLCTVGERGKYSQIHILDPDSGKAVVLVDLPDAGGLHSPVFLGPRSRPPILPSLVDRAAEDRPDATGVFFCQDARLTLNTTAGRRHVRAVRVLAGRGLTTRSSHSYIVHAGSEVIELGTVPLTPDGSFAVEVPADTPIAFQMVDAEGRSELNEMSWNYVRPGERRGCVGCHEPRGSTPLTGPGSLQAMSVKPVKMIGGDRSLRFRGNNAAVTGLMELQFDRFREVAGINRHRHADGALAVSRSTLFEQLLADLRSDDATTVIAAAQRLALHRDRAAAPALVSCLSHSNREVRIAAAMAIAACGTRDSASPLLAALADPDSVAAQAAAVALENLTGHAEPAAPLDGSPDIGPAGRWRTWMNGTSWDRIEVNLVERLTGGDDDEARVAAVALGHIGGDAARAALRAYVDRARHRNPYPAWRRSHQGDNARFNASSEANPRTLQAAVRALGALRDAGAVPMLEQTLATHADPVNGNLFLAEATIDALGRIGTAEAESALINALPKLGHYWLHSRWYGDHDALIACHASPAHYRLVEALDAMDRPVPGHIVPHLIRMLPTDPDRALLLTADDMETLVGRLVRRASAEQRVVETCLSLLGDTGAVADGPTKEALAIVHGSWAGTPDKVIRAAQVLSVVASDRRYEPRISAAFARFAALKTDIPRVFNEGIPIVKRLPAKHWVCFYLARAMGALGDPRSAESLMAALRHPAEADAGRPDPLGPGVLFLHNDLTPCWRAAAASALGKIGHRDAVPLLITTIKNLDNATDTRHAAAEALRTLAAPQDLPAIGELAAQCPEWSVRKALLRVVHEREKR